MTVCWTVIIQRADRLLLQTEKKTFVGLNGPLGQFLLATCRFIDWGLKLSTKERVTYKEGRQESGPEGPAISKRGGIKDHAALSHNSHPFHLGRVLVRLSNGPMQVVPHCFEEGITLTMIVHMPSKRQVAIDDSKDNSKALWKSGLMARAGYFRPVWPSPPPL